MLDLCSGAGGATRGYIMAADQAGVDLRVTGVDHRVQNRYLKSGGEEFIQADMFEVLEDVSFIRRFKYVHVSPPCQIFSSTRHLANQAGKVDLLTPLRPYIERYARRGQVWIIENVEGAPLVDPTILCGSSFPGLHGNDARRQLRRHRKFETHNLEVQPLPCRHNGFRPLGVYGNAGSSVPGGGDVAASLAEGSKLMGIDWMNWRELREAIPPAYTEYVGQHMFGIAA